jgi:ankyrin repeat protein
MNAQNKLTLLLIGPDIKIQPFFLGHPNVDIIGDGEKIILQSEIPYKHYDKVVMIGHGSILEGQHYQQLIQRPGFPLPLDTTINIINVIIQHTSPKDIHIISCYGGYVGKSLAQYFMKEDITFHLFCSDIYTSESALDEEYIFSILSGISFEEEIALIRDELPQTLMIYRFGPELGTGSYYEINAPRLPEQILDPKLFKRISTTLPQLRSESQVWSPIYCPKDRETCMKILTILGQGSKFSQNYLDRMMAIYLTRGNFELAKACKQVGANPNFLYKNGISMWSSLVSPEMSTENIKVSLSLGLDPNLEQCGTYPILLAINNENLPAACVIIEDPQCDVTLTEDDGYGMIHYAAQKGYISLIEWALKNKIDITQKTKTGINILSSAASAGHLNIVDKCVTEWGFDVNNQDNRNGGTPILGAIAAQHFDVVKYLLQHGAKDVEGPITMLILACMTGNFDIVQAIVLSGVDLNAKHKGRTALDYAKEIGIQSIIDLLTPQD